MLLLSEISYREYFDLFIHILTKGKKDNTYKFALAKFLLDFSIKQEIIEDKQITFYEIASAFLKYYWYQEYKYRIKQDFKTKKQPVVISILHKYCGKGYIHLSFDNYFSDKKEIKEKIVEEIEKKALNDVIPRFQPEDMQIFYKHFFTKTSNGKFKRLDHKIILYKEAVKFFKDHFYILNKALILEWAKFLEKINFTPQLISKIEYLGKEKTRKSLRKFLRILSEIDGGRCFYCGRKLKDKDTHIDHFIPWSYIFEDELWNLVLSCSSCNLKKSNFLPPELCLDKIEKRNKKLDIGKVFDIKDLYYNAKKAGFLVSNDISCYIK